MRKSSVFATTLLATLLMAVPTQSHAFFGFFGGGFSFGFGGGWGGWGGPWGGWGGPWGGWGGPGYFRHYYPYRYRWHRPYAWHYYQPYHWAYPYDGLTLPYAYVPQVAVPVVQAPATSADK